MLRVRTDCKPVETTGSFGGKRGFAQTLLTQETPCAVGEGSGAGQGGRSPPGIASLIELRELRPLQGDVRHQALRVEDESDDRITDRGGAEVDPAAHPDHRAVRV